MNQLGVKFRTVFLDFGRIFSPGTASEQQGANAENKEGISISIHTPHYKEEVIVFECEIHFFGKTGVILNFYAVYNR